MKNDEVKKKKKEENKTGKQKIGIDKWETSASIKTYRIRQSAVTFSI